MSQLVASTPSVAPSGRPVTVPQIRAHKARDGAPPRS